MRALAILALVSLASATPVFAARGPDPCLTRQQTFMSPAGEPFRSPAGAASPATLWFAQADADRDGALTAAEMRADAARFFAVVDRDGNGEIVPDELTRYEREIAPEISTFDTSPLGRRPKSKQERLYGGPLGAGRYAMLNIPNPIASADSDFNRGITRAEFATATGRQFVTLAKGAPALRLAGLPPTPQAAVIAECAARAAKRR